MSIRSINKIKVGESIKGFFLCKKKFTKTTRLGDIYIDLLLKDKTGSIRAKLWSHVDHFSLKFNEGDIVAVKGTVISFNKNNEINIKYINVVLNSFYDEYDFSDSLLMETIKEPKDKLIDYIFLKIKALPRAHSLVLSKIYKENLDKIKSIPIAVEGFDKNGGFLLYTYRLLKIYANLNKEYRELNYEKVIACILLINIGFIDYYNIDSIFTITERAKKICPKILGLNILLKTLSTFKSINEKDEIFYQQCLTDASSVAEININFVHVLIDLESVYNNS